MFSMHHLIWLTVCAVCGVAAACALKKHRPPLRKVLSVACVFGVASELIKTLSVVEMVPSADGSMFFPYLELQHLPLHICSLQIALIFYTRFSKESRLRETLLAFMYPTCLVGAFCALLMPSIFGATIEPHQAFSHPIGYQYFLYHTMLIVLGGYIAACGEVHITGRHFFSTLGIILGAAFASLYINSAFSVPVYRGGKLISVEYNPNFLFTAEPPIDIPLTEPRHWYIYMGILLSIVILVAAVAYLPFYRKSRKKVK